MIHGMEHLETVFDRVEYLQNLLIDEATGGSGDDEHYQAIRMEILDNPLYSNFIPRWIKVKGIDVTANIAGRENRERISTLGASTWMGDRNGGMRNICELLINVVMFDVDCRAFIPR